jgi:uncharacterized protein YegL
MGRKRLSSPPEKNPVPPPPEKKTSAGGLEGFQRERPFRAAELTLIAFLLDISMSMSGRPIQSLKNGFQLFLDAVAGHPRASKAVEVALIAVCGEKPTLLSPFQPASNVVAPTLEVRGGTPLNSGFLMALNLVKEARAAHAAKGIDCRTPFILAMTDGEATDEDYKEHAKAAIAAAEGAKPPRVEVHGLAVNAKALGELEEVLSRRPVLVSKFNFEDVMRKLSSTLIVCSTGDRADISRAFQEPLDPAAEQEPRDDQE